MESDRSTEIWQITKESREPASTLSPQSEFVEKKQDRGLEKREDKIPVTELCRLDVSGNRFFNVAKNITNYKHLTDLNLSNNSLDSLPVDIRYLFSLRSLNLSNNNLTSLPESIKSLCQLTTLNLADNKFSQVPSVLYLGLRMLNTLDLSFNSISQFCDIPQCVISISHFNIANNKLHEVPSWLFNALCHLKSLNLSNNPVKFEADPFIYYYRSGISESLQDLLIENCNVTFEKLDIFSNLSNLKSLDIGNRCNGAQHRNSLGNVNVSFLKNFSNLRWLSMSDVSISVLPVNFDEGIKQVEYLDLSRNMLTWLPDTMCNLINLKVIILTNNQIVYLPRDIGKLANLQEIHTSHNQLYDVPGTLINLKNLQYIDLYDNKLEIADGRLLQGEKLRGIDLGLNQIDFQSAETGFEFVEKYNSFKSTFREHFGLSHRCDSQRVESSCKVFTAFWRDEVDEEEHVGEKEEQQHVSEEDDQEVKLDLSPISESGNAIHEEDWEQEICTGADDHDDDDGDGDETFDPCSITTPGRNVCVTTKVSFHINNFCPSTTHLTSLTEYCVNKLNAKVDTVEGQFDSD